MMIATIQLIFALCLLPPAQRADASPSAQVTSETEHGVLVVRHRSTAPAPAATPQKPEVVQTPSRDELILARLADLGLVHIRPVERQRSGLWSQEAPWTYKPTVYHGYHPKPDWRYRKTPGWRYNARSGWRYRPEPAWAERPGAVEQLLSELPSRGDGWYVTRWQ